MIDLPYLPHSTSAPNTLSLSDNELLNYIRAHARTARGLVHRKHLERLFQLAESPMPAHLVHHEWFAITSEDVEELIQTARSRLCTAALAHAVLQAWPRPIHYI